MTSSQITGGLCPHQHQRLLSMSTQAVIGIRLPSVHTLPDRSSGAGDMLTPMGHKDTRLGLQPLQEKWESSPFRGSVRCKPHLSILCPTWTRSLCIKHPCLCWLQTAFTANPQSELGQPGLSWVLHDAQQLVHIGAAHPQNPLQVRYINTC